MLNTTNFYDRLCVHARGVWLMFAQHFRFLLYSMLVRVFSLADEKFWSAGTAVNQSVTLTTWNVLGTFSERLDRIHYKIIHTCTMAIGYGYRPGTAPPIPPIPLTNDRPVSCANAPESGFKRPERPSRTGLNRLLCRFVFLENYTRTDNAL